MSIWNEFRGILTLADKVLILCAIVGIIGTALGSCDRTLGQHELVIEIDGRPMPPVPLADDRQLAVIGPLGTTRISIQNRAARITHSPCTNKVCVSFGQVRYSGQLAVCLPNAVVMRVVGGETSAGVDAISH